MVFLLLGYAWGHRMVGATNAYFLAGEPDHFS